MHPNNGFAKIRKRPHTYGKASRKPLHGLELSAFEPLYGQEDAQLYGREGLKEVSAKAPEAASAGRDGNISELWTTCC